ncbi:MAG: acetyltransferase [Flavobacteriales bacterium]|nr:MAG: acetyltransferase [Flavobacteriales bacterium]
MKTFLNFFIKKIKGESYQLDSRIPLSYLIYLVLTRIIMLFRGILLFPLKKIIFIGRRTKVKCRTKIKFGKGTSISENCYLDCMSTEGIILGNNVSVGRNTTIECSGSLKNIGKGLLVGNNVGLGTHGFFGCAGGIEIGNHTIFGNYVSLHSENHNYSNLSIPIREQGVNRQGILIGEDCWIGAKVTILDGVTVEQGCIIAAGSLLNKGTYAKNGIYGGVPAKLLKLRTEA